MSTNRIIVGLKGKSPDEYRRPQSSLSESDLLTTYKNDRQDTNLITQGYYHPKAYAPSLLDSLDSLNEQLTPRHASAKASSSEDEVVSLRPSK